MQLTPLLLTKIFTQALHNPTIPIMYIYILIIRCT